MSCSSYRFFAPCLFSAKGADADARAQALATSGHRTAFSTEQAQVKDRSLAERKARKERILSESFNPLNQVYVFNAIISLMMLYLLTLRFNPLNQVYVFNLKSSYNKLSEAKVWF